MEVKSYLTVLSLFTPKAVSRFRKERCAVSQLAREGRTLTDEFYEIVFSDYGRGQGMFLSSCWCREKDSNPRPLPYQGNALPLSYHGVLCA